MKFGKAGKVSECTCSITSDSTFAHQAKERRVEDQGLHIPHPHVVGYLQDRPLHPNALVESNPMTG